MAEAAARLVSIHRYPVKGFGAQTLAETTLTAGAGIAFDRFLGVANGDAVVPAQGWAPCQAFVRMTRNAGLPLFDIAFDDDRLRLSLGAPGCASVAFDLADSASLAAANAAVAAWFPPGRLQPPSLVRRDADLGWWDVDDAPISIINRATVRHLQAKAGRAVAPLQFRANLYVDDLPAWREWEWIGKRLRIGEAELEVLRPIERCKATSIDPRSAEMVMNMPALLAGGEGHLCCGLYARVVRGGRVRAGDDVTVRGEVALVPRADLPPPETWPRWATLERREDECEGVASFWLRDPLAALRAPVRPGQHLRVHLEGEGAAPLWRSYTVSAVDGELLRLTIQREAGDGCVSRRLHERWHAGDTLLISGPFGSFHLGAPSDRPLVLLSGGVGITPIAAMLLALAQRPDRSRPVHVLHGARHGGVLALWPQVQALVDALPNATRRLFLSRPAADDLAHIGAHSGAQIGTHTGRIDTAALRGLPLPEAEVFLCGPGAFAADLRRALLAAGARDEAVFSEAFASPAATRAAARAAPLPGPFELRLPGAADALVWTAADGSLLEAAEAAGIALPANCRAGVCGACRQTLARGSVTHLVEAPFPLGPHEVLTCCAVPTSDVVLEARP